MGWARDGDGEECDERDLGGGRIKREELSPKTARGRPVGGQVAFNRRGPCLAALRLRLRPPASTPAPLRRLSRRAQSTLEPRSQPECAP